MTIASASAAPAPLSTGKVSRSPHGGGLTPVKAERSSQQAAGALPAFTPPAQKPQGPAPIRGSLLNMAV
jgi:hypothetical protein